MSTWKGRGEWEVATDADALEARLADFGVLKKTYPTSLLNAQGGLVPVKQFEVLWPDGGRGFIKPSLDKIRADGRGYWNTGSLQGYLYQPITPTDPKVFRIGGL